MARLNKIGLRYGKLVVLRKTEQKCGLHSVMECICDCGNLVKVSTANLRNTGGNRSCGCNRKRQGGLQALYKGEYDVWTKMLSRCQNKKDKDYPRYGGRGIRVYRKWADFKEFLKDMGPRPRPGLQLDRKDNNKSYTPINCRWVTPKKNSNNRRDNIRFTYKGKTKTLVQWSRATGIPYATMQKRLKRGWTLEDTITVPVMTEFSNAKR